MIQPAAVVFHWPGIDWSFEMFWPRLGYVAAGLVIVLITSLRFTRFDPALMRMRVRRKKKKATAAMESPSQTKCRPLSIHQIAQPIRKFALTRMVLAELQVMLKGYHWTWYLSLSVL